MFIKDIAYIILSILMVAFSILDFITNVRIIRAVAKEAFEKEIQQTAKLTIGFDVGLFAVGLVAFFLAVFI